MWLYSPPSELSFDVSHMHILGIWKITPNEGGGGWGGGEVGVGAKIYF